MKPRFFPALLWIVVLASGLIVLLAYWSDAPVLRSARDMLVHWAAVLSGVALLAGILNLLWAHWNKVAHPRPGGGYSLALLIAFILTLLINAVDTPTGSWSLWIFQYVQLPVEASLIALLPVLLILALIRMFTRRADGFALIFAGSAIILLAGMTLLPSLQTPVVTSIRNWLMQTPVMAGARGMLLGVGLGVLATGLRNLTGMDRPYNG